MKHLLTAALTATMAILLPLTILSTPAHAQHSARDRDREIEKLNERLSELEKKVEEAPGEDHLEEELIQLRLEQLLPEELEASFNGYGPEISKVYFNRTPISVGGFGELSFVSESEGPRITNVTRVNLIAGFRYSQNLVFNSGYSFQNGGAVGSAGATRVEFAYIDFLTGQDGGVRAGHLLIPFGITNLRPSPTSYSTVNRPLPETTIIPTTWHENGILGYGQIGSVQIQGGIFNGGYARNYESETWIRGGRQNGAEARSSDPALALRIEHIDDENTLGASLYYGNSGQEDAALGQATVVLGAIHGEYRKEQFFTKALLTRGTLSDTGRILAETGRAVGQVAEGGSLIFGYDLLPRISRRLRGSNRTPRPDFKELPVFFAWEHANTQVEGPNGASGDPAARHDVYTLGANYRPHPQVVIKGAYSQGTTGNKETQRFVEFGLGYIF